MEMIQQEVSQFLEEIDRDLTEFIQIDSIGKKTLEIIDLVQVESNKVLERKQCKLSFLNEFA